MHQIAQAERHIEDFFRSFSKVGWELLNRNKTYIAIVK